MDERSEMLLQLCNQQKILNNLSSKLTKTIEKTNAVMNLISVRRSSKEMCIILTV